jgi:copper homeostasis protein
MILEACVENLSEALKAESRGANRIELCDNLYVGGTTPSAGTIQMAMKALNIPVMVLIRPRSGNFVYSDLEVNIMKHDIEVCKQTGVQGIVIGALKTDHSIDVELMEEFIRLARPLQVTFHKAIDETPNIIEEFKKLMELGVDHVLTSGGHGNAREGSEVINEMVRVSQGKVKILAAGKITETTLNEHIEGINTDEFHGKLIVGNLS